MILRHYLLLLLLMMMMMLTGGWGLQPPRLGQSHYFSGKTPQPKMEKEIFLYLLNETRSSATAEKQRVSCPHGGG